MAQRDPRPGDIWRHWKGTSYRVRALGLDSDTTDPVVIYQDAENELGTLWVRPLEEWHQQTTASSRRFELLKPMEAGDGK